ncbi:CBS domain-containing protein [Alteromonas sp. ASW11-36]|uniref:CBS domain-containing protein n=1 Tax=Alteromonas arenosi TaxID=3055817 RepID=A0ABT7T2X9_9ALTE|nr:CBS domain-containing protein [Alteromonas sp. ASW11-36]MDM7862157.1 CBS domain-containing protein [Alteromonas sp. ASW11-36]
MVSDSATVLDLLEKYPVAAIASTDLLTAYEGWSIKKLSEFFAKHRITGAPVIASDETLVGVVTQTDVVKFEGSSPDEKEIEKIIQHYIGPQGTVLQSEIDRIKSRASDYCTVNSIMTPEVFSIDETSPISEAYNIIESHDIHRLFVTRESVLIGVVTAMDILNWVINCPTVE